MFCKRVGYLNTLSDSQPLSSDKVSSTPDWNRSFIDQGWIQASRFVVDAGHVRLMPFTQREVNPSLEGMRAAAEADLARMRREPARLTRPVILLNGYHAWAGIVASLRRQLIRLTSHNPRDFLDVSYFLKRDFPNVRSYAIDEVAQRFSIERSFDFVGISMGGLIARLVTTPDETDQRTLRAERIFTIASPHRGANRAKRIHIDPAARDMIAGSKFLERLNRHVPSQLRCYTQIRDEIVGATNTAPPGMHPFWMSGTWVMGHFTATRNPMILADIARHLRGEQPLLPAHAASVPVRD
jgi:pimeloyl-ACP methyl ester carboxylesterase